MIRLNGREELSDPAGDQNVLLLPLGGMAHPVAFPFSPVFRAMCFAINQDAVRSISSAPAGRQLLAIPLLILCEQNRCDLTGC
jgi:hypothetical protein